MYKFLQVTATSSQTVERESNGKEIPVPAGASHPSIRPPISPRSVASIPLARTLHVFHWMFVPFATCPVWKIVTLTHFLSHSPLRIRKKQKQMPLI